MAQALSTNPPDLNSCNYSTLTSQHKNHIPPLARLRDNKRMKLASLTAPLKHPQNAWQWLCLLTLIVMGWVSREQLGAMFVEEDDGSLVVYDRDGNPHVYLSDTAAGRTDPYSALSFDFAQDEQDLLELDTALMKPSCCDAPDGLCHFWDRPRRLGQILAAFAPRPALTCHPGQGVSAADPGSSIKLIS